MVAADGAHGLRTRAPGARSPPPPPQRSPGAPSADSLSSSNGSNLRRSPDARRGSTDVIARPRPPGCTTSSTTSSARTRTTTSYRVHDEQERELNDAAGGAQGDRRWGARGAASPWDASPQPVGAVRGDHKGEDAERGRTAAPADRRAPRFHARTADHVSSAPSVPGGCCPPRPPARFPKRSPPQQSDRPRGILPPPAATPDAKSGARPAPETNPYGMAVGASRRARAPEVDQRLA